MWRSPSASLSSGGPLFDLDGKVIGITTAIVSGGRGNIGLNFAIPINTVKNVLPQSLTGKVVHGWLGVVTLALNTASARHFGLRSASERLYVFVRLADRPTRRACCPVTSCWG